jgi:hypothetical protein
MFFLDREFPHEDRHRVEFVGEQLQPLYVFIDIEGQMHVDTRFLPFHLREWVTERHTAQRTAAFAMLTAEEQSSYTLRDAYTAHVMLFTYATSTVLSIRFDDNIEQLPLEGKLHKALIVDPAEIYDDFLALSLQYQS